MLPVNRFDIWIISANGFQKLCVNTNVVWQSGIDERAEDPGSQSFEQDKHTFRLHWIWSVDSQENY